MRAFPPRLIHVMAGNAPSVAALTMVRAALTKGVHLLELASNDLFTPTAILGTMAEMAPDHPVTLSSSATYWRGGDVAEIDGYCAALAAAISEDHRYGNCWIEPTPSTIREEVEVLRTLEPMHRVFGREDGSGLVIRSDEPVVFLFALALDEHYRNHSLFG